MTTLEQALQNVTLTPFEGKDVRQVGLEAPTAAGGLRDAMRIDPVELHQGDRVVTIMEHVVTKVRFEPIDRDDPGGDQRRVHVLSTETAAIAGGELVAMVRDQLGDQRERLARAKAEAKGYPSMVSDDELTAAHAAGQHTELMPGCVDCAAEEEAAADETPDEMSDEEWEASNHPTASPAGTTPIAGRRRRGAKEAK